MAGHGGSKDDFRFREIQPGEIITIQIKEYTGVVGAYNTKNITGILRKREGSNYFIIQQKNRRSIEHPIYNRQMIKINGVEYDSTKVKLTSKFKVIQKKKYKDVKEGILKLSNTQQKEFMGILLAMFNGIGNEAWVTYNTVQTSIGRNSEKYSKSQLLSDIVENLKGDPKKHYAALMQFFNFLKVNEWSRELTQENLNERINLIKILKSVFFIKRINLNDHLNLMMSFYDKTLYAKTLPLKDKINLIAHKQITRTDDFRSFFPLMKRVTILRYEDDTRQQQVQAVGELVHYMKQIIDRNPPAQTIGTYAISVLDEWNRLQRDKDNKSALTLNPIEELVSSVVAHSKHRIKERQVFNPEEADTTDIDALEEKFEDDDAFQEWKTDIESKQKAKKARNNTAQEAVIIARIESDETASANDIEAIVGTVKSSKVKQKLSELAEERQEKQEECEAEEAKKHKQKAAAQKAEAAVVNAVQDNDVTAADLETIASKVTSPKAKAKFAEAIDDREEANEEREAEEAKKHKQKAEATIVAASQDDNVTADDLETIASKVTSPKAKAKFAETIDDREEADEEREAEETKKHKRKAAAQKAEATIVAAAQDDNVTVDDLETMASKVTSPKAKAKFAEAIAEHEEEQDDKIHRQKATKKHQRESREVTRAKQVVDDPETSEDDLDAATHKTHSPKAKAQIEEAIAARAEENDASKTKHTPLKAKKPHSYDRDDTDHENSSDDDDFDSTLTHKSHSPKQEKHSQPKVRKARSEMTAEERTIDNREKRKRQKENKRKRESLAQTTDSD